MDTPSVIVNRHWQANMISDSSGLAPVGG